MDYGFSVLPCTAIQCPTVKLKRCRKPSTESLLLAQGKSLITFSLKGRETVHFVWNFSCAEFFVVPHITNKYILTDWGHS